MAILMAGGRPIDIQFVLFDGAGAIGTALAFLIVTFMPIRAMPALLGFLASLKNPESANIPQAVTAPVSGGSNTVHDA
jgi:hypothetical protein